MALANHFIVPGIIEPCAVPFDFVRTCCQLRRSCYRLSNVYAYTHCLGVESVMVVANVFLFLTALLEIVPGTILKVPVYPKTFVEESQFIDTGPPNARDSVNPIEVYA